MRTRRLPENQRICLLVPSSPGVVGVPACPLAGLPCSETDAGTGATRTPWAAAGRRRSVRNTSASTVVSNRRPSHVRAERRRS